MWVAVFVWIEGAVNSQAIVEGGWDFLQETETKGLDNTSQCKQKGQDGSWVEIEEITVDWHEGEQSTLSKKMKNKRNRSSLLMVAEEEGSCCQRERLKKGHPS